MKIRRKARETALQILYRMDIDGAAAAEFEGDMDALAAGTEARRYCEALVGGVRAGLEAIDAAIEEHSENWKIDRMAVVDRNILRVAVWEMENRPDVPYKVIIDEAVELAKRFGSEDSAPFINGIIDRVGKALHEKQPQLRIK